MIEKNTTEIEKPCGSPRKGGFNCKIAERLLFASLKSSESEQPSI